MRKPNLKTIKKHAKSAVAVSVASAGILVGGLFSSPNDLMNPDGSTPTAVVQLLESETDAAIGDGGEQAEALTDERRRSLSARVRAWIWQLPPWLRALAGVPLWGLGWLLISTLGALWTAVLSPVMGGIVQFLCIVGLVIAVLCVALKAAFPDIPLKEIVNKRTAGTLTIGLALVGASGWALGVFYPEGQELAEAVRWLGAAAVLLLCAVPVIVKHKRVKTEA